MHFNLFQNEAVGMPQNCSLWILMSTFCTLYCYWCIWWLCCHSYTY